MKDSFAADSQGVHSIYSTDGNSWIAGSGYLYSLVSWSLRGSGSPVAFKALSGNLGVTAVLNKGSALPLNGSATLELIYL